MTARFCIILNPAAKGERARKLVHRIQSMLPDCQLQLTRRPGHAQALARQAVEDGFEAQVAAGGDGTLNEVVNGIAGADVALGLLPVGTMNVFALELGLPTDLEKAIRVLQKGRIKKLDLAHANDRFFVQLAGIGLDAQIVAKTDWNLKKSWGPLSYVFTAGQIIGNQPPVLQLETNEGRQLEGSFVLIGNGRYYGGRFTFFPYANMQDGLLDVCVFQKVSYLDLIRYLSGIVAKRHTRMKDVCYFKTEGLQINSAESVPMEVDGELHGCSPAVIGVERKALNVIVP